MSDNQSQDAAAKRRARQTLINLLLALGATLAVVVLMVVTMPRDDSNRIKKIDYAAVVAEVKTATGFAVPAPAKLPDGWWVNVARFNNQPKDGVKTWHIGFVGPNNQYLGLDVGYAANLTWLEAQPKSEQRKVMAIHEGDDINYVIFSGTASEAELALFESLISF